MKELNNCGQSKTHRDGKMNTKLFVDKIKSGESAKTVEEKNCRQELYRKHYVRDWRNAQPDVRRNKTRYKRDSLNWRGKAEAKSEFGNACSQ